MKYNNKKRRMTHVFIFFMIIIGINYELIFSLIFFKPKQVRAHEPQQLMTDKT